MDARARLDHLIYAVPRLEEGIDLVERRLGVRAVPVGRHPAWGTRNALLALGTDSYLELLALDPDSGIEPRLLGLASLEAPRLATWVVRGRELERRVEEAAGLGVDLGRVLDGERQRPDGSVLTWRLTDPNAEREGGVVPFWIDWGDNENPARSAPGGCSLAALTAEHPDPVRMTAVLAGLGLDLPVAAAAAPALVATLGTPRGLVELR